MDNVLGYGSSTDMAAALAKGIKKVNAAKVEKGQDILFIASICGTEQDIQVYSEQKQKLEEVGVLVVDTNAEATYTAIEALKYLNSEAVEEEKAKTLLNTDFKVINMGLESFATTVIDHGGQVVQYNWTTVAGGDPRMQSLLEKLSSL